MTIGTRSLLFGVHQAFIHPWFVALAWWKLYGFPCDPRLWVAFFVHDLGYFGKPNMDGPEGEHHVELGARIMGLLFGRRWRRFTLYHSRFYATRNGMPPSRLCYADKLAIVLTPKRLYLVLGMLSGEIDEYMERAHTKYRGQGLRVTTPSAWHATMTAFIRQWVADNTRTT